MSQRLLLVCIAVLVVFVGGSLPPAVVIGIGAGLAVLCVLSLLRPRPTPPGCTVVRQYTFIWQPPAVLTKQVAVEPHESVLHVFGTDFPAWGLGFVRRHICLTHRTTKFTREEARVRADRQYHKLGGDFGRADLILIHRDGEQDEPMIEKWIRPLPGRQPPHVVRL